MSFITVGTATWTREVGSIPSSKSWRTKKWTTDTGHDLLVLFLLAMQRRQLRYGKERNSSAFKSTGASPFQSSATSSSGGRQWCFTWCRINWRRWSEYPQNLRSMLSIRLLTSRARISGWILQLLPPMIAGVTRGSLGGSRVVRARKHSLSPSTYR